MSSTADRSGGNINGNQAASNSKPEASFTELETWIQKDLPSTTVDRLKTIIEHLNTYPNLHLAKTGRKSELVERLQEAFRSFRRNGDLASFRRAKSRADEIMYPNYGNLYGGTPNSSYRGGYAMPGSSTPTTPTTPTYGGPAGGGAYGAAGSSAAGSSRVWNANAMSAGVNRGANASPFMGNSARNGSPAATGSYNAWGQQVRASGTGIGSGPMGAGVRPPQMINWKQTPAWTAIKAVTEVFFLAPIEEGQGHSHHKKEKQFTFALSGDILAQLNYAMPSALGPQPPVKKDLRIFCTSSDYYPNNMSSNTPTPIEWPHVSEMSVNNRTISNSIFKKGLKGQADTAPPLHIGAEQGLRLDGTVVLGVMTHTGPSINKKTRAAKKFAFQICLTDVTSTAELRRRVLTKRKSKETIISRMKAKAEEDEIEIGSSKLQLKCPLSYARIQNPIRAETCGHVQCCDLDSWLSVNESTPRWTCPSCETEMKFEQVYIDEFFLAIVQACPESVDEVILEGDGEWHTEDGKHASPAWKAQNPVPQPSARSTTASRIASRIATPDIKPFGASSPLEIGPESAGPVRTPPSNSVEIIALDDSDDEDTLPPPSRPSVARSDTGNTSVAGPSRMTASATPAVSNRTGGTGVEDAIDLCDSDDEEPQPRRSSLTPTRSAADIPLPPSPPSRDVDMNYGISPQRRRSSLADLRKKRTRNYAEDSDSPLTDESDYAPPPAKKKRLSHDDERDDTVVDDDLAAVWGDVPARPNGDRGNSSTVDAYVSKPPGITRGPRITLNVGGRGTSNRNPRTPSPTGRNGDSGRNGNAQAGSSRNGNGPPTWNSFSKP